MIGLLFVALLTAADVDAAIEQAYLDRYGTSRTDAQLTTASKTVWVQNILLGTVPWTFNACGVVWSLEVLRCSLGLVPVAAPIQQSFGVTPPPSPPSPSWPDATPALNDAVRTACAGDIRTLHYGAGTFHFLTPPTPFPCGIWLTGEGKGATLLQRDYDGDFLAWVGGQEGGGGLERMAVYAGPGTVGGAGVRVQALARDAIGTIAGAVVLRDVTVSGAGTWDYAVVLDGSQRQDCTNACGVRIVRFDNVHLFQATVADLLCLNCIAFEWIGGGAYGSAPWAVMSGQKNRVLADVELR